MAISKIKYIGTTSSGRGFKYEIIADTDAKVAAAKTALEADKVVFNPNLGVVGFISQTHLYTTPKIGDVVDVDVKGYEDERSRQVNWFKDIDKIKQKAFAENKAVQAEVASIVGVENALTDANSSLDVYKFEQIRLLRLQQAKLSKEIALIASAD
jgi:hypothetical protein